MNKQWLKQNKGRGTGCHHFRGGTTEVQRRKVTCPRILVMVGSELELWIPDFLPIPLSKSLHCFSQGLQSTAGAVPPKSDSAQQLLIALRCTVLLQK